MKNVVTIGGGKGHAQVLKALKLLPEVTITAVCPSTDSGGSTGVLLREYDGSGYTGDLTRCVAALCDNEIFAKALLYRFHDGALDGHVVKNILFHTLEKVTSHEEALKTLWEICGLKQHRVLPVTNEKTELCATLRIGNTISGETNIDLIAQNPLWNPDIHSISDVYLKPETKASPSVLVAVGEAEYVIIAPGDLYSSTLPTLLPSGMKEALISSRAKIILILNMMTKKGETDNYTAHDFINTIEKRLGRKADYIFANNSPIPDEMILKYSLEQKIELNAHDIANDARIIEAPLVTVADNQIYTDPLTLKRLFQNIFDKK